MHRTYQIPAASSIVINNCSFDKWKAKSNVKNPYGIVIGRAKRAERIETDGPGPAAYAKPSLFVRMRVNEGKRGTSRNNDWKTKRVEDTDGTAWTWLVIYLAYSATNWTNSTIFYRRILNSLSDTQKQKSEKKIVQAQQPIINN